MKIKHLIAPAIAALLMSSCGGESKNAEEQTTKMEVSAPLIPLEDFFKILNGPPIKSHQTAAITPIWRHGKIEKTFSLKTSKPAKPSELHLKAIAI